MQLNIYLIAHPIIQTLSKSIQSKEVDNQFNIYKYRHLGILLIYEVSRKLITMNSLYIKKMNYTKELSLPNNQEQNYICTPLNTTYQIVSDINLLLPQMQIIDTGQDLKSFKNNFKTYTNQVNKTKIKIIILETILYESRVLNLIQYLNAEESIPVNNIHIACIVCYNTVLNLIGLHYSQLKIYTTKIIQ